MTEQEIHPQSIKPLPTVDRLKLAQMILTDEGRVKRAFA